ncbi:hypothetical protein [Arthrobacter sp. MYb213]|uniref:hypothetical protein n=1 Tax=Arthrobacter sp. MYb213 TaxID=1848595 RepID=UPI000CFCAC99|nr:hypothetical protein [Arthrobacter sp. MYb213]PRB72364.1 hypothetical protein CQ011_01505 [Arthrobacter sp. MYb213]
MSERIGQPSRRILRSALGFGVLLLLAGILLVWWDSRQMVTLYAGSYVSLREDTFHFGPSLTMILGQLLIGLGIAACGVAAGFSYSKRAHIRQISTALIIGLGVLFLLLGIGLLWWDSYQVKEFGWFAYAPLSNAELRGELTASAAPIFGKIALGLGFLGLGVGRGLAWGRREQTGERLA